MKNLQKMEIVQLNYKTSNVVSNNFLSFTLSNKHFDNYFKMYYLWLF